MMSSGISRQLEQQQQQQQRRNRPRTGGMHFDQTDAQQRFEGKWRSTVDSSAKEPFVTPGVFPRLSRDDAVAAQADELRSSTSNLTGKPAPKRFVEQSIYADTSSAVDASASSASGAPSRRAALRRMKQIDEEQQQSRNVSKIEITHGPSTNPILKALNDEPNNVAIASESALARGVLMRDRLPSRRKSSSWDPIREDSEITEEVAARSSDRDWDQSEGHYRHTFDSAISLEHHRDSVQYAHSIYSKRDMHIPGLWSYHGFITPLEEKRVTAELTRLLLKPAAAFHASEGRYCVNLFEKRLDLRPPPPPPPPPPPRHSDEEAEGDIDEAGGAIGLSGKGKGNKAKSKHRDDPLAFSLSEDAPVLYSVLERAARLGLIPAMPNVVQVSEMVSAYSGYPPHLKHTSIGNYYGILNLVSRVPLDLQCTDRSWAPRLLLMPRGMYIFEESVLRSHRIGYRKRQHVTRTHQGSSRFSKDYRIEVAFATVDGESVPRLRLPVQMSEYADRRHSSADGGDGDVQYEPDDDEDDDDE